MDISGYLKVVSTATGEAKKISDDIKGIHSNFPWLNFQNITLFFLVLLIGILAGDIYQPVTNALLVEKQQRDNLSENIITTKSSDKVLDLPNDNKIDSQNDVVKEISTTEPKQAEIIAVEFVSDNVFDKGIAASCTNSKFYNRKIELKNPFNLKNNTIVDVTEPINCENENRTKAVKKCGTFPRMQIPFLDASELFPEKQNLQKNITSLNRCELVQVEIVQNN